MNQFYQIPRRLLSLKINRLVLLFLFVQFAFLFPKDANASHYRYGNHLLADVGTTLTPTGVGLPEGVTFTPNLPASGNPVTSNFSFAPTPAPVGTYVLTCAPPFVTCRNVTIHINAAGDPVTVNPLVGSTSQLASQTKGINSVCPGSPISTGVCDCPPGYVATGYSGQSGNGYGNVVSNFRLKCRALNPDGTLGTATAVTCVNGAASGGSNFNIDATSGEAIVGFSNRMGCGLDQLKGLSKPIPDIVAATSNASNNTMTAAGGAGGGPLATQVVPDGMVIVGMQTFVDNASNCCTAPGTTAGYAWRYASIVDVMKGIGFATADCGLASATLSQSSFNCSDVGENTITLTVTDANGNTATCQSTVTVLDEIAPTANTQNVTIYLDANGAASTTATAVNNGSTDNCGIANYGLSKTDFDCSNVGTNTVTLTVTDASGNTATANATVTVKDNMAPSITCAGPVTINITPGLCTGTTTLTSPTVTDNCSSFIDGAEMITNGGFSSGATAWNACGNLVEAFCSETCYGGSNASNRVAEIDHQPVTLCQNISGFVIGKTYRLSFLASRRVGSPSTVGAIVTIDGGGLSTTVNRSNTSFNLTPETFTFVATQTTHQLTLVPTSGWSGTLGFIVDNFSIKQLNGTVTNNAPPIYPIGNTTVTWTATDSEGNSATCTQTVTVVDPIAPTAKCKNATVTLSGGTANITVADIDNGSTDNCGIKSYSLSKTTFDCSNIGNNTVTLTVTDYSGNTSTCQSTVTVNGATPSCSISVTPSNNTYTGGNPNVIYLGYGPQSVNLTVSGTGGSSFTYSWTGSYLSASSGATNVFTPTTFGTYNIGVTTTNNYGCQESCSVTICVLDIRSSGSGNTQKVYLCHLPPGNPGNPQTLDISVNAVPAHLSNHTGDHLGTCTQVCGTLPKRASSVGQVYTVDDVKETELIVYPNPNGGKFTLEVNSSQEAPLKLSIYNYLGQEVYSNSKPDFMSFTSMEVDLSNMASSYYMVKMELAGQTLYKKVIVMKE